MVHLSNDRSASSDFSFKKEERLSGKKSIDELFKNGSSFYLHPFKIVFTVQEIKGGEAALKHAAVQVFISVPKRNFKRSVDRNKIKRLIREAYRQNKSGILKAFTNQYTLLRIAFLYTAKTIETFAVIQDKVVQILTKLSV